MLFFFSNVSASEITNDTFELIEMDNQIEIDDTESYSINNDQINNSIDGFSNDNNIELNNENSINTINSKNSKSHEDILSLCDNDKLSSSIEYTAVASAKSKNYGTGGHINIQLYPLTSGVSYDYHFYVNIYDSNGGIKIQDVLMGNTHNDPPGTYYNKRLSYFLSGDRLGPGDYTVKIVDFYTDTLLTGCKFTINPIHYSEYTVNVQDTNIKENSSGIIKMTISPTNGMYSRYDFNLKVYDSKSNRIINTRYAEENVNTKSVSYFIAANSLEKGVYSIMVVDNTDGYVFDTAKLTIGTINPQPTPQLGDYVVSVENTNIYPDNSGTISMSVSHVSFGYDFYLEIYDSNNNLKISKKYSGDKDSSLSYQIEANSLPSGEYDIKIVNSEGIILSSAKLTVCYLASDYNINVHGTTTYCGSSSEILIRLSPASSPSYEYDFTLKIYDSNNNIVATEYYSGQANNLYSIKYPVSSLGLGNYTAKVCKGNKVYGTAKVIIVSLPHTAYSVNASIKNVNYIGNNIMCLLDSQIKMSISSKSRYSYKYDFYLKVYDSNNVEIISERYYSTLSSTSLTYEIPKGTFSPGKYTIKIIHATNNYLLNSVNFTMKSVDYSDYTVDIADTVSMFGSVNFTFSVYSSVHKQDFYLKIYNSNNQEIFNKRFYDTKYTTLYYRFVDFDINPGVYTIKILNTQDNHLMKKAKLTVKSVPHSAYSVNISDVNVNYLSDGNIVMSISPASSDYTYKYDFYLKIRGSSGEIISERYYNTSCSDSLTYHFNATTLNPGSYFMEIINSEDKHQLDYSYLKIDKIKSNIVASPISTMYNNGESLVVILKDSEGNPIRGATLSVTLDGVKTLVTDSNGQAKLSTSGLVPNNYNALISFLGNELYEQSSANVNVTINKQSTQIIASSISASYNDGKSLVVILKDRQGKVLSGIGVSINMNGAKYFITDNAGQIKVPNKGLIPKNYVVSISFNGNNKYIKSFTTVNVLVKKATPKIIAKAKTFKKSVKTKKYKITLRNNLNRVMKNTKVTIKVNKKTYTAKTNKNGAATFKLTKLNKKGNFKSVITYKGDKYYNKVTKTIKIKVK